MPLRIILLESMGFGPQAPVPHWLRVAPGDRNSPILLHRACVWVWGTADYLFLEKSLGQKTGEKSEAPLKEGLVEMVSHGPEQHSYG